MVIARRLPAADDLSARLHATLTDADRALRGGEVSSFRLPPPDGDGASIDGRRGEIAFRPAHVSALSVAPETCGLRRGRRSPAEALAKDDGCWRAPLETGSERAKTLCETRDRRVFGALENHDGATSLRHLAKDAKARSA